MKLVVVGIKMRACKENVVGNTVGHRSLAYLAKTVKPTPRILVEPDSRAFRKCSLK